MVFNLQNVVDSKTAMRRRLASLTFDEKLVILEQLRDSALAFIENRPTERLTDKMKAALEARRLWVEEQARLKGSGATSRN